MLLIPLMHDILYLIGESVIIDNSVIIDSVHEARGSGTHSSFATVLYKDKRVTRHLAL